MNFYEVCTIHCLSSIHCNIRVYETSGLIDFKNKRTLTLCGQFKMFEILKSNTKTIFVSLSVHIVTKRLHLTTSN